MRSCTFAVILATWFCQGLCADEKAQDSCDNSDVACSSDEVANSMLHVNALRHKALQSATKAKGAKNKAWRLSRMALVKKLTRKTLSFSDGRVKVKSEPLVSFMSLLKRSHHGTPTGRTTHLSEVCADPDKFVGSKTLDGVCFWNKGEPTSQDCKSKSSCDYDPEGYFTTCHCETKQDCDDLDGEFKTYTCDAFGKSDHPYKDSFLNALGAAHEAGTCNIDYEMEDTTGPFPAMVDYPAEKCCSDWETAGSWCPPIKYVSPCEGGDMDTFDSEAIASEYCNTDGVSQEKCESAGCTWERNTYDDEIEEECYCENEAVCEAGTYEQETCADLLPHFNFQAQMDGVDLSDENIAHNCPEHIASFNFYLASRCCRNYAAMGTLCKPVLSDAPPQHMCANVEDYTPLADSGFGLKCLAVLPILLNAGPGMCLTFGGFMPKLATACCGSEMNNVCL